MYLFCINAKTGQQNKIGQDASKKWVNILGNTHQLIVYELPWNYCNLT